MDYNRMQPHLSLSCLLKYGARNSLKVVTPGIWLWSMMDGMYFDWQGHSLWMYDLEWNISECICIAW